MATAHSPGPEDGPLLELDDVPPDDQEVIAAEIRALMGRHRVTQARLAAAAGMSSRGMSERLSGKTNFTIRELGRVARFFGKSLGDLVGPLMLATAASLYVTRNEHPPSIETQIQVQLRLFGDIEPTEYVGGSISSEQPAEATESGPVVTHQEAA